ncbi:MAG TPA: PKD domain-containing protein [Clostridia bacterium]|nr:PKD domain-containing protein [Clostridia bacterium]
MTFAIIGGSVLALGLNFSPLAGGPMEYNGRLLVGHEIGSTPPARSRVRSPSAYPGKDQVVRAGDVVQFHGHGASPDHQIVEYSWDFESDGVVDFVSPQSAETTHVFASPGVYQGLIKVRDSMGQMAQSACRISVVSSNGDVTVFQKTSRPALATRANPVNGIVHRHAILFNGGAEERYWVDMTLCYAMLTNKYGFSPADIYLLNHDGTVNGNSNGIINYPATLGNLKTVVSNLTTLADLDDEVFFCITDHGRGYSGPLTQESFVFGYLDGRASVDPGDEPDFPESNFKLRSLMTGGNFIRGHGMNEWKVYDASFTGKIYRHTFVSHFDNLYVASLGMAVSDHDVLIERLVDYARGDYNKDGSIDSSVGEVFDFDGDGNPPYNSLTGEVDEDDWGPVDELADDYNYINTQVPDGGYPYRIFDYNFEGKLCIDLGYAGGELHMDGRDEDGLGLFDWMDVNQDGDTNDMISIDEAICTYDGNIYDDDLRELLNQLSVGKITIVAEPCFSGGLVEDLSASNRVICTATTEDALSWGDVFIREFIAALHGNSVHVDTDGNGAVSMLEAFNHAAAAGRDFADETPQYDDNGDKISHAGPVPSKGDGTLGANTYLTAGTVSSMNEWTKSTSGNWEEACWSRGQLPARGQGMVAIRNPGWKAVAIGHDTVVNHPEAVAVDRLTIEGPPNSFNTLLLNYAGLDVPLVVGSDLLLGTNASLLCHYSALRGGNLYLSSPASFLDGSQVAFTNIVVGSDASAQLSITNSYLSANTLTLGSLGSVSQWGGAINASSLQMAARSIFVVSGAATLTAPLIEVGPAAVMVVNGGSVSNADMTVLRFGGLRADGSQRLGKLQVLESTNSSSGPCNATIYVGPWRGWTDPQTALRFQDSHDVPWSGSGLWIVEWTFEKDGSAGDHIFVGTSSQGLSASQIAQVSFVNPTGWPQGHYAAQILPTGELVPVTPTLTVTRNSGELILAWTGAYQLVTSTNVAGMYLPVPGAVSPFSNRFDGPPRFFRLSAVESN